MEIKVTSFNHEDLVNILSTALYGCDYLSADYEQTDYEFVPEDQREGDCYEDKMADILLNGSPIYVTDYYAEGESMGKLPFRLDADDPADGPVTYQVYIKDFYKGASTKEGMGYATELLIKEEGDYYTANNLLQIILFGEVVYG